MIKSLAPLLARVAARTVDPIATFAMVKDGFAARLIGMRDVLPTTRVAAPEAREMGVPGSVPGEAPGLSV